MSKDPAERLQTIAGFDAAKGFPMSDELFKEVLEEVNEGRKEEAKKRARDLLTQALDIREQMVKAERAFTGQQKKFQKTLGKLLNRLEAQLRNQPPPKEEDDKEEGDTEG